MNNPDPVPPEKNASQPASPAEADPPDEKPSPEEEEEPIGSFERVFEHGRQIGF